MDKFDQLYKKYEDLVSDGSFDGDARDKVDTILQMIYDTDDPKHPGAQRILTQKPVFSQKW